MSPSPLTLEQIQMCKSGSEHLYTIVIFGASEISPFFQKRGLIGSKVTKKLYQSKPLQTAVFVQTAFETSFTKQISS